MVTPITLALDWDLNTNHSGFVVAKAKNYYTDEELDLSLVSPGSEYTPPADLVRGGKATFGITPSETVLSSLTRNSPLKVMSTLCSYPQASRSRSCVDHGLCSVADCLCAWLPNNYGCPGHRHPA